MGLQTKTGTCDFEPKISGAMVSVEFKENSQICSLHNLSNTQYKGLIRIISRSICNVDSIDQSGLKSKILCGVSPNTIVSEASDLNDCEIVSRD